MARKIWLIKQEGNIISGTDSPGKARIIGIREGDTITYDFWMGSVSSAVLSGECKVNVDGTLLEGYWESTSAGDHHHGQRNITRIEWQSWVEDVLSHFNPMRPCSR